MTTKKVLVTADELRRMPDDGWRYELVKGKLVKMPPGGGEHGGSSHKAGLRLGHYAEPLGIGEVLGAETGFLLEHGPDTVRAPDAAVISKDRLPGGRLPRGYIEGPPDLAVEVVAHDDHPSDVQKKVEEWLAAGAQQVWVLYCQTHTVRRYEGGREPQLLREDEILTGEPLLPGFACRVRDLFA